MVVDLDLFYIYLASVLIAALASTSPLTSEVNILNSHNLLIFQARRPKFCNIYIFGIVVVVILIRFAHNPQGFEWAEGGGGPTRI